MQVDWKQVIEKNISNSDHFYKYRMFILYVLSHENSKTLTHLLFNWNTSLATIQKEILFFQLF